VRALASILSKQYCGFYLLSVYAIPSFAAIAPNWTQLGEDILVRDRRNARRFSAA
jgi:hypothetical protein